MNPLDQAFAVNCGVALMLGLAIGLERQLHQHPAGLRTNALLALGAALFVSLSPLLRDPSPTHVAAQVASGIGFLCGGVILRDGLTVKGLTTAATLWCSGAIGALSGSGFPRLALISTVIILITNVGLHPISEWLDARIKTTGGVETNYRLRVICGNSDESAVRAILFDSVNAHPRMVVHGIVIQSSDQPGQSLIVANIFSTVLDDRAMQETVTRINLEPSVKSVSWDRAHSN
jgi:putative Mg2+ transporter-C (MgtC) family protein